MAWFPHRFLFATAVACAIVMTGLQSRLVDFCCGYRWLSDCGDCLLSVWSDRRWTLASVWRGAMVTAGLDVVFAFVVTIVGLIDVAFCFVLV